MIAEAMVSEVLEECETSVKFMDALIFVFFFLF